MHKTRAATTFNHHLVTLVNTSAYRLYQRLYVGLGLWLGLGTRLGTPIHWQIHRCVN